MRETKPEEGLGALGRDVADDAMRLVRAEIEVAKAELKDAARRLMVAVVLLTLAAVLLLIGVIEALGAAPEAVSQRLFGNRWLGWLAPDPEQQSRRQTNKCRSRCSPKCTASG